jgi:hypothetical protein
MNMLVMRLGAGVEVLLMGMGTKEEAQKFADNEERELVAFISTTELQKQMSLAFATLDGLLQLSQGENELEECVLAMLNLLANTIVKI